MINSEREEGGEERRGQTGVSRGRGKDYVIGTTNRREVRRTRGGMKEEEQEKRGNEKEG